MLLCIYILPYTKLNKNAENRTSSEHPLTSVPTHTSCPHNNSDFRYMPAVSTLTCSPFPLADLQLFKISSEMLAAINSFCFKESIFFLFSKMKTVQEGYARQPRKPRKKRVWWWSHAAVNRGAVLGFWGQWNWERVWHIYEFMKLFWHITNY